MNKNTLAFKAFLLFSTLLLNSSIAAMQGLPEFTVLVEENAPAVVNISTTQKVTGRHAMPDMQLPENSPLNDLFRRFFEDGADGQAPRERNAQSLGSGFILSADGFIMTNHHVVKDADQIIVRLSDRKTYEARVIGADEASDVALLKIDAVNLPSVKIGKSSEIKVGEWVLAIGSPFGFDHSVTAGIVSAKGRSLPSENYVPYIQTDVAINPGNSGGPLFNLDGEVVGINSQIYSRTGGFMGLSFAIPIELALNVVEQLKATGQVSRGYLGVLIQDVTHNLAESFGMSQPQGALVSRVLPDSPAAKAGLEVGDVILSFNGQDVRTSSQLPPAVGATKIDSKVALTILRNGKQKTVDLTVGVLPNERKTAATVKKPPQTLDDRLGLVIVDIPENVRIEVKAPNDAGVLVSNANAGIAKLAGIREGDIILMLDGRKMTSAIMYNRYLRDLPVGKSVAVLVHREQGPIFIALKLSAE